MDKWGYLCSPELALVVCPSLTTDRSGVRSYNSKVNDTRLIYCHDLRYSMEGLTLVYNDGFICVMSVSEGPRIFSWNLTGQIPNLDMYILDFGMVLMHFS